MKRSTLIVSVLTMGLAAGLTFLSGCQSDKTAHHAGHDSPGKAVMCDKCKTVWIQQPGGDSHKPWTAKSSSGMACPECKTAVANFFSTGKLQHTCSACGGHMDECEMH